MKQRHRMNRLILAGLTCVLPTIGLQAQVSTNQSTSLLFFPKIVADDSWDTLIQIANVSSNNRRARCFYVDGRVPRNPDGSPVSGPPPPKPIEFDVWLTPVQPTHWVVSRGRFFIPTDPICSRGNPDCEGAGFDPGDVPKPPPGFHGYAFCVETDASGFPVPGNALVGKATLTRLETGDVGTYAAIGFRSFDVNDQSEVLCLGGGVTSQCPAGAEYAACPAEWRLQHPSVGSEDPVAGVGSRVGTSITIAPCPQNVVTQIPAAPVVQLFVTNEFEQLFSASTVVTHWTDTPLESISTVFEIEVLGSATAQTRIAPASDAPGFVVIAQTFRETGSAVASTALNLQRQGTRPDGDVMVLPIPEP